MMGLNAVAAGCGPAVSRRHVTNASAAHGQIGREQNNPVTELVKFPETALQELDYGIDR